MFENMGDSRASRWNRMPEYTSQLIMCHTTILHNRTLGMV